MIQVSCDENFGFEIENDKVILSSIIHLRARGNYEYFSPQDVVNPPRLLSLKFLAKIDNEAKVRLKGWAILHLPSAYLRKFAQIASKRTLAARNL